MYMTRFIASAVLLSLCVGCGTASPTGSPKILNAGRQDALPTTKQVEPATKDTEAPPADPAPAPAAPDAPVGEPPVVQQPVAVEPPPPEASTDLYSDSFADVTGSIRWSRNGAKSSEGPPAQRTLFFFSAMPEDGNLAMRIHEDAVTTGPDGQPGVLALSWEEIPAKLPWSGFVYLGRAKKEEHLLLPRVKNARSAIDLEGVRLKFRYRGISPNSEAPVNLKIGCRLEPQLADSYNRRLDLGSFEATEEWGTFNMLLADCTNQDAFFKCLAEEQPAAFKIVWGQQMPISQHHAGDTLLIDDIAITGE
jgi:hypothetical protein